MCSWWWLESPIRSLRCIAASRSCWKDLQTPRLLCSHQRQSGSLALAFQPICAGVCYWLVVEDDVWLPDQVAGDVNHLHVVVVLLVPPQIRVVPDLPDPQISGQNLVSLVLHETRKTGRGWSRCLPSCRTLHTRAADHLSTKQPKHLFLCYRRGIVSTGLRKLWCYF